MITANNMWEANALRKLPTVADVERELARTAHGLEAAPTAAKKREWQSKISFLHKLRAFRAGGRGL